MARSPAPDQVHPPPVRRALSWLRTVRRRILLHRRFLAAGFAALAVLAGLHAARDPGPATFPVWTASRDLVPGQLVGAQDLVQVDYRAGSQPDGLVSDPGQVLGRMVASPVRRGEPITDRRVVGRRLFAAYPGRVATPVRLSDPAVAALLRPGDRVDLVATDPQGRTPTRTVASGATVIVVPTSGSPDEQAGGPQGRLVLFAVPDADATAVAAAGATDYLTVLFSR